MSRRALTAALVALATVIVAGVGLRAATAADQPPALTSTPASPQCTQPAPSTVLDYERLFSTLPSDEWGAADVSISVPLPDARDVWLYGDTFTTSGHFFHSTAIVQDGGCLHVSHAGAQLLPDDDATHIYWITSAVLDAPTTLMVTAQAITLTGPGVWGFQDRGYARTAEVMVSAAGDLTFAGWTTVTAGAVPSSPLLPIPGNSDPHRFGYGLRLHPEARLADGDTLTTISSNWDDLGPHPLISYRPVFGETPSEVQ